MLSETDAVLGGTDQTWEGVDRAQQSSPCQHPSQENAENNSTCEMVKSRAADCLA
jgi:hypothetical protein